MARLSTRERIRRVVEKWFVTEPLFLSVWTMHELVVNPRIGSIRTGRGRIEYNPAFIDGLNTHQLAQVLDVEAMRIVLKHPYLRRKPRGDMAYKASNLTLQEYLDTALPFPRARDVFGEQLGEEYARQYFEFYYVKLLEAEDGMRPESGSEDTSDENQAETQGKASAAPGDPSGAQGDASGAEDDAKPDEAEPEETEASDGPSTLEQHTGAVSANENTQDWGSDDLFESAINEKILAASESNTWGTKAGRYREQILAALRPKLDYRAVLRQFRTSVLSVNRCLTRMKPNRRYGFLFMGSRYDFTTHLLFAVDVSGSMGSDDLALGFSAINRFFKYGVPNIDVVQFDTEIKGDAVSMKKAQRRIVIEGRGGTSFHPVIEYIDEHKGYDGCIIYTDGYAPVPPKPKNRSTRIMWLFTREETYSAAHEELRDVGRSAFLKEG